MSTQGKPLPAADLAGAFGKSPRSAGLRLPPGKKAAQSPPEAPERPISAVPDPSSPLDATEPTQAHAGDPSDREPADPSTRRDSDQGAGRGTNGPNQSGEAQTTAEKAKARAPGTQPSRARRAAADEATRSAPTRPAAGQAKLVLWTPLSIRARMQRVQAQRGTLYLDQVLDALESTVDQLPDLVARQTATPHVQGKLFERAVTATETSEQRVQLTIRGVLNSQIEVIDQLVATCGAPSRSALVNAALDASLPR